MPNKIALIIIGRFKPAWDQLSADDQTAFAIRVGRTARQAGVTPVVGYKLTTQRSFLEIWEADDKATLEAFVGLLAGLGYKQFYDEVLMIGERAEAWIGDVSPTASPTRARRKAGKTGR